MMEEDKKEVVEEIPGFEGINFGDFAEGSLADPEISNQSSDKPEVSIDDILNTVEETGDTQENTDEGKPPVSNETETADILDGDSTSAVDKETSSSAPVPLVELALAINEAGGLASFDEEAFKEAIKTEGPAKAAMALIQDGIEGGLQAAVEEKFKTLTPDEQENFTANQMGVNPVEYNEIKNDIKILTELSSEALDDDEVAEKVLRYNYQLTTKWGAEKIEKKIQQVKDLDELTDEAKESIPDLITTRKEALSILENTAANHRASRIGNVKKEIETLKELIYSTDEIIPGVKYNKSTQQKIEKMITSSIKGKDGRQTTPLWAKRDEDPHKFDMAIAYFIENGGLDKQFKVGTTKSKTAAFKELENKMSKTTSQMDSIQVHEGVQGLRNSVNDLKNL